MRLARFLARGWSAASFIFFFGDGAAYAVAARITSADRYDLRRMLCKARGVEYRYRRLLNLYGRSRDR